MTDDALWPALAIQFPIVAAILIALWRGWIRIGSVEDRQDVKDKEALAREREMYRERWEFSEQLRLRAVAERDASEGRIEILADALREASGVTARAADLVQRLVERDARAQRAPRRSPPDRG